MNDDAIAMIYAQVRAPAWAARNLDALAEVLRDLSWLPDGPVELQLPARASADLTAVLQDVARETAGGRHPVRLAG